MGVERRSRVGGHQPEMAQRRARASRSGARLWLMVWHRGTAVALSCILAAGLVPVTSFAQGSETIAAARESLRANASGAAADGAGNGYAADGTGDAADAGGAAANSADGGLFVVGSEVVASGEGSAAALGAQGSQSAQSSQGKSEAKRS